MTADTRLTRTKIPDLNGPGFYYPEYRRRPKDAAAETQSSNPGGTKKMLPPKNYFFFNKFLTSAATVSPLNPNFSSSTL